MKILDQFSKRIGFVFSLVSLMAAIATLIMRAKRDVNPHHDGVILAPAIAVYEGKTPNLDVFSQYGFLIPYIQGFWLHATEASLYSLRLFTVLQVLLIAYILYLILRKHFNRHISILVSVSWIVSYPKILPFLPWPSVTSTLFLMAAILGFTKFDFDNKSSEKYFFLSYICLCLATLIRPQIALITIVILVIFITKTYRSARSLLGKLTLFSAFPIIILILAHSFNFLEQYLQQSILWAGSNYGGLGFTLRGILELLIIPIVGGTAYYGLKFSLKSTRMVPLIVMWILGAVLSMFVLIHFSWNYPDFPYFALKHPTVFFANLGINILNTLSYLAFLILLFAVYRHLMSRKRNQKYELDSQSLILIVSFFSILQLYPASDPLHFWWLAPIFIVGGVKGFADVSFAFTSQKVVSFALSLFVLICTVNLGHEQSYSRIHFETQVLKGMTSLPFEVAFIDASMYMIQKIPADKTIRFDCSDGLYSVAGGHYRPKDRNFVNWAPFYSNLETNYDYIFQCNVKMEESTPSGFDVSESVPVRLGISGVQQGFVNRLLIRSYGGTTK